MTQFLGSLAGAVDARDAARSRQAAIDVARSSLDLQLRYRPAAENNLARFDLWAAQVLVDVAGRDAPAVNGDVFTIGYIRDRILGSLDDLDMTRINTQLLALQVAAPDADFAAAGTAATQLRNILSEVKQH